VNGAEGFWVFMIILVTFWFVREIVRMKYNSGQKGSPFQVAFRTGRGTDEVNTADAHLLQRLDKLEKRVANLEAIIIEQDKRRAYDELKPAV
jgi:hypothetical protein